MMADAGGGKRAVVLLSGGLDSTTAAGLAREAGYSLLALTVDYNQRHEVELEAARAVAAALGVERHVVLGLDLKAFGGSALTADIAVPKGEGAVSADGVPVTYVPARNSIFLSLALGFAEAEGATDLFIGVNALDYSGYPDCRPEFIAAFEAMAALATKAGVEGERFRVHAPLVAMTKAEIVREAERLGLDLGLTWSCYDPVSAGGAAGGATLTLPAGRRIPPSAAGGGGVGARGGGGGEGSVGEVGAAGVMHCGRCDSCRLRRQGFAEAGVRDPTRYAV